MDRPPRGEYSDHRQPEPDSNQCNLPRSGTLPGSMVGTRHPTRLAQRIAALQTTRRARCRFRERPSLGIIERLDGSRKRARIGFRRRPGTRIVHGRCPALPRGSAALNGRGALEVDHDGRGTHRQLSLRDLQDQGNASRRMRGVVSGPIVDWRLEVVLLPDSLSELTSERPDLLPELTHPSKALRGIDVHGLQDDLLQLLRDIRAERSGLLDLPPLDGPYQWEPIQVFERMPLREADIEE